MEKLHQSALRKGRVSIAGHAYAITKCQNIETNEEITQYKGLPEIIIDSFLYSQKQNWLQLGAFVTMLDHYHLLFRLGEVKELSEIIRSINSFIFNRAAKEFRIKAPLWQEGFYDHAIRSEESLIEQINYIEDNPVRAKLCNEAHKWPYSSANDKWKDLIDRSWIR